MKKKFLVSIALFFGVLCCVSCGGNNSNNLENSKINDELAQQTAPADRAKQIEKVKSAIQGQWESNLSSQSKMIVIFQGSNRCMVIDKIQQTDDINCDLTRVGTYTISEEKEDDVFDVITLTLDRNDFSIDIQGVDDEEYKNQLREYYFNSIFGDLNEITLTMRFNDEDNSMECGSFAFYRTSVL